MKILAIIGLALFTIISCSKNEVITNSDAESVNSVQEYSFAKSSHDSLVISNRHHDTVGIHHHDKMYHHHDSLFYHSHGNHMHNDSMGHHMMGDYTNHPSHHAMDSIKKVHPSYHPH